MVSRTIIAEQRASSFRYAGARLCYALACDADVSNERRNAMFRLVAERQRSAARLSLSARRMYDDFVAAQKFWRGGP